MSLNKVSMSLFPISNFDCQFVLLNPVARTPITESSLVIPNPFQSTIGNRQCHHSYRSATNGSTLVARRAGIKQATRATETNNRATQPNVNGSVGVTPYRRLVSNRVIAH